MVTPKGFKHSEESKIKMRLCKIGTNHPLFGKHHTEETKRKMKESNQHFWLGKNRSNETKIKISLSMQGKHQGVSALHIWGRKNDPPPKDSKCAFCHKVAKLDRACVTGKYEQDFSNWKYLCRKCHKRFDMKKRRKFL